MRNPQVTMEGNGVARSSKFKYLDSIVQSDREIDEDIKH